MNFTKKHAYTLAEIMLVLLVLSIIFAACAPFFTKRMRTHYTSKYNVWDYVDRNSFDAFYSPGDPSNTAELFFGVSPDSDSAVNQMLLPLSKMVIRSGEITSNKYVQKQLQFRYGRTSSSDSGKFAGNWLVSPNNMLLGGSYPVENPTTQIDLTSSGARDNVAIGFLAQNTLRTSKGNTAVGYAAMTNIGTSAENNVAIGYNAGRAVNNKNNTFIGTNAGYSNTSNNNTFIGYNAGNKSTGAYNTFIGYNAAGTNSNSGNKNVAIGDNALGNLRGGEYNVAIGQNALKNLENGSYNVAIGYNACSEVKGSYKTCIGANSGPHAGTTAEFLGGLTDSVERTYIGSKPQNFGGDAVLEIHNPTTRSSGIPEHTEAASATNTTTIINGNLIVKGRPYFTAGNTLHHFHNIDLDLGGGTRTQFYGYRTSGVDNYHAACLTDDVTSYEFDNNKICPNLNTTSDRRLKNIGTRSLAGLKELNKLTVYNFTFKNDPKKAPHVGVMAQDLQKVFPNSVFQGEDGYLRIKWDEMFYATINAIKELDRKIVALVKHTTNAETQISKLERENTVLKSQVYSLAARVNKLKAQ